MWDYSVLETSDAGTTCEFSSEPCKTIDEHILDARMIAKRLGKQIKQLERRIRAKNAYNDIERARMKNRAARLDECRTIVLAYLEKAEQYKALNEMSDFCLANNLDPAHCIAPGGQLMASRMDEMANFMAQPTPFQAFDQSYAGN